MYHYLLALIIIIRIFRYGIIFWAAETTTRIRWLKLRRRRRRTLLHLLRRRLRKEEEKHYQRRLPLKSKRKHWIQSSTGSQVSNSAFKKRTSYVSFCISMSIYFLIMVLHRIFRWRIDAMAIIYLCACRYIFNLGLRLETKRWKWENFAIIFFIRVNIFLNQLLASDFLISRFSQKGSRSYATRCLFDVMVLISGLQNETISRSKHDSPIFVH